MAHFHSNALIGASGQGEAEFIIERSLRFNSDDTAYLSRDMSSASSTYTFSTWIKRTDVSGSDFQYIFASGAAGVAIHQDHTLYVFNGSSVQQTTAVFRDPSAWFHLVFSVNSGSFTLYVNGASVKTGTAASLSTTANATSIGRYMGTGSGIYYLDAYLAEIHFVDGTALAPTAFAEEDSNGVWQPKAYSGSYGTNGFYLKFADNSSNAALGTDSSGNDNTWTVNNLSAAARNYTSEGSTSGSFYTSAGGAASKMFDGDASTGAFSQSGTATFTFGGSTIVASTSLQVRAFKGDASGANVLVNGTDISSLLNAQSSGGYSTVNITSTLGGAPITLANVSVVNVSNGSGNIAQIFVDGVELVDASASDIDSLIDSPMNYEAASGNNGGNYCVWNPLSTNSAPTFSDGNLTVTNTGSGAGGWRNIASNIAVSSGKWYMEFDTVGSQNGGLMLGIQKVPEDNDQFNPASFSNNFVGMTANSFALNCFSGAKRTNSSDSSYGSGMSVNDKIMMAVDLDNGKIWWGKNGTWFASGDPDSGTNAAFTGLSGTFVFALGISASEKIHSNFGQRPYEYSNNISGFKGVCTQNLDESTYASIADGSTAFDATLYTGNGSSQTISGLNHSPDIVWTKARSFGADHEIYDIVRGTGKRLFPSLSNSESTPTSNVNSFNSDGFGVTGGGGVNNNTSTYVGWTWDAGSSTVSNTNGSVTSNVRASQANGCSVVTWTGSSAGQTVGHGLGASPELIIVKARDQSQPWAVYHSALGRGGVLQLHSDAANVTSYSEYWGTAEPSSTVFGTYTGAYPWANNYGNMVAYCFAPIEGFSAFGSYAGNSSSDGPHVVTGFRPKFLIVKVYDQADHWVMWDSVRGSTNVNNLPLYPNLSNSESANISRQVDLLSNGFKLRATDNSINGSHNYIYIAFAEHPFKTARAR